MPNFKKIFSPQFFSTALIVSALGYFVDTFDIVIFSVTRVPSLTELGYSGDILTQKGLFLLNMQLGGMLIGGILWGCIGDRKGRSSALFFSILCYSLANIANGFVDTVESYAICRFVSGIGLAGELGAAVTLVMEELPKSKRGLGAMFITSIGTFGAVTASLLGGHLYWRTLYFLGGALGLLLLFARSRVKDSKLFTKSQNQKISRGNFLQFFKSRRMFSSYLACTLIGIPHYLFFSVLVTLSPEIGRAMGLTQPVSVPTLLTIYAVFLPFGDISATLLSQYLKSRKKAVLGFATMAGIFLAVLFLSNITSITTLYILFAVIGFFAGYIMLGPVIAAETFGTNLRVTATSMVTNGVRASAILMNLAVVQLKHLGILTAVQIVSIAVIALALLAALALRESFHKEMDFFD
jgi:MFS family permease